MFIIRLAAKPPYRRGPLSSNVRAQMPAHDYGSFAKVGRKLLAPSLSGLGYEFVGSMFVRTKPHWVDVIALQQSQFGSGSFCVNLGLHVPSLGHWWRLQSYEPAALAVAHRLSPQGVGTQEKWFPAANRVELERSIEEVAAYLPRAEPWFAAVRCVADIAALYSKRHGLSSGKVGPLQALSAANYGFLLAQAGSTSEARVWLVKAESLLRKSGAESVHSEYQLAAVAHALSELAP
jgi:hypothetical protein